MLNLDLAIFVAIVGMAFAKGYASTAVNPGVKIRITKKGLDYVNSVAQKVLAQELKTLQIPNQSGKDGHISWELTNIRNQGVTPPSSSMSLDPAHHGVGWALSNLGISLHADWRVKYRKGWVKASTSGSVDASVRGVSLSVVIGLGVDKTGRPSLTPASCSAHVGGVSLDFHGGTAWLINLFKGKLEDKVRSLMQAQICSLVNKEITTDAAQAMQKLKVTVEVAKRFLLDYRLVSAPVVTSTYLELEDKGEIFWKDAVKEAPFSPQPIPAYTDVSRMLYIWLTDYTAKTFAFSAQTHNYLKYNITKDDLPPDQQSYLNTSCKLTCIGTIIPQIGQKYPNCQVKVNVRSTSEPTLAITPKGISTTLKANIDMYAEAAGKPDAYLLTLNLTLDLSVSCAILKERLVGKILSSSFKFGVVKSTVGQLNPKLMNIVLNAVISLVVIPELNKIAEAGIDLPVTGDVTFNNTQLTLLQGSVMIGTDLTYTPNRDTLWKSQHHLKEEVPVLLPTSTDQDMTFKVVKG